MNAGEPAAPVPVSPRRAARVVRGALRRVFVGALLVLLAGWCGLVWLGFPPPLARQALRAASRGAYAFEAESLTLDVAGRIVAHQAAVYRKGLIGPPIARAGIVRFRIDPLGWAANGSLVRDIEMEDAQISDRYFCVSRGAPMALPRRVIAAGVAIRNCDLAGLRVARLYGALRVGPTALNFTGFDALAGPAGAEGRVEGSVRWTPATGWSGQIVASLDPRAVVPLWEAAGATNLCELARALAFGKTPPECALEFDCRDDGGTYRVSGRFHADGFVYRGAPVTFANLNFVASGSPTGSTLTLRPLVLVLGNGTATGFAALDFREQLVDFEVSSTADLGLLARVVQLTELEGVAQIRWGGGTRLYARGRADYGAGDRTEVHGRAEGPGLGYGPVRAEQAAVQFDVLGVTNVIRDARGRMYGGSFTASATIAAPRGEPARFELRGEIIHADFTQVMREVAGRAEESYEGRLYGSIALGGEAARPETLVGQGYVSMRNGRVFRIPLFGGLTEPLSRAIPGVDFALRQTDVRIPFRVENGAVASDAANIEGDILSLSAKGRCGLDGALDFAVQVKPLKEKTLLGQTARVLTYPVSKLFEFRLGGTLDRPEWKAENLPLSGAVDAEPAREGGAP